MSDIPQLVAAIDGRLTELAAEITALESAKAALDGARAVERIARPRRQRHDVETLDADGGSQANAAAAHEEHPHPAAPEGKRRLMSPITRA